MQSPRRDTDSIQSTFTFQYFCWWSFAFAGVIAVLVTLLYGYRPRRGLGLLSMMLNLFMMVSAGAIINFNGFIIYNCANNSGCIDITGNTRTYPDDSVNL
jgi:hypothetical protein